ncbi:hypothetical protein ON010_g11753 [Phytophthora cinnamomi]|nr:hypothetical protein ON010_g11753 [Phytophthora cinnamomi]
MHFLAPFLKSQESRIDRAMKEAVNSSGAVIADISNVAKDIGKDVSKAVASKIVDNAAQRARLLQADFVVAAMSSASYAAWAQFDVEKELERVDQAEQREQQHKQQLRQERAKQSVESSATQAAQQSADILAAQAAVAALKAKKRVRRGRAAAAEEEEVTEWQPPAPKGGTPASGSKNKAPTPPPSYLEASGSATGVGRRGPQEPSNARHRASEGAPSAGIPATERHNDGKTFLQDGFGGLEALVQMGSLGATELAHIYDCFEEDDVISDFILTSREDPLSESELMAQLKSFRAERELASILSQFDAMQLAYRTFGTVSLLRKVTAKYDVIKRRLEQDTAVSEVELQEEVLQLKRTQQFQADYWVSKVAGLQKEKNAAMAQACADFLLLMEERASDVRGLRAQVKALEAELKVARASRPTSTPRSQGPHLRTAHAPGPSGIWNPNPSRVADCHYGHRQRQSGIPGTDGPPCGRG